MAEVIIKINDNADNTAIDIEVHSSDMTNETSAANAVAEFLGASWDSVMQGAKMYAEAVRQAREAQASDEADALREPGDAPIEILSSNPRILKADGSGVFE